MSEILEADSRYPGWMKAWNANVEQIDQRIIEFFYGKTEPATELTGALATTLEQWWDSQELEAPVRHEYESARSDAHIFSLIERRVRLLEAEGKLNHNTASPAGGRKS